MPGVMYIPEWQKTGPIGQLAQGVQGFAQAQQGEEQRKLEGMKFLAQAANDPSMFEMVTRNAGLFQHMFHIPLPKGYGLSPEAKAKQALQETGMDMMKSLNSHNEARQGAGMPPISIPGIGGGAPPAPQPTMTAPPASPQAMPRDQSDFPADLRRASSMEVALDMAAGRSPDSTSLLHSQGIYTPEERVSMAREKESEKQYFPMPKEVSDYYGVKEGTPGTLIDINRAKGAIRLTNYQNTMALLRSDVQHLKSEESKRKFLLDVNQAETKLQEFVTTEGYTAWADSQFQELEQMKRMAQQPTTLAGTPIPGTTPPAVPMKPPPSMTAPRVGTKMQRAQILQQGRTQGQITVEKYKTVHPRTAAAKGMTEGQIEAEAVRLATARRKRYEEIHSDRDPAFNMDDAIGQEKRKIRERIAQGASTAKTSAKYVPPTKMNISKVKAALKARKITSEQVKAEFQNYRDFGVQ